MCILPKAPAASPPPAAAPAPPVDAPAAPQINATTSQAANASEWTAAQRRGANSLKIDLATPGNGSAGLAIPT